MPLSDSEVDSDEPFDPSELLYRRIAPNEQNAKGEIDPTRFNSISFSSTFEGAPSVNRSRFSKPEDVLHIDCAGKELSGWLVYFVSVESLPETIESGDKRVFKFLPRHVPLPSCGAHSVIATCLADDVSATYVKPSQAVINEFRVKLATTMRRVG